MRKSAVITLSMLAMLAAPLRAELLYSVHLEVRKNAAAAPAAHASTWGDALLKWIVPGGALDETVVLGDKGMLIEPSRATPIGPLGSVELLRSDGTAVVFNPNTRTYWTPTAQDAALAAMRPTATARHTGEYQLVAGSRSERVTVAIALAEPPRAGLAARPSPGAAVTGELWMAPQYKAYSHVAMRGSPLLTALGLQLVAEDGLVLRQVLRGGVLGDSEVEMVVSGLVEEAAPPDLFDVPAGFREVAAPLSPAATPGVR